MPFDYKLNKFKKYWTQINQFCNLWAIELTSSSPKKKAIADDPVSIILSIFDGYYFYMKLRKFSKPHSWVQSKLHLQHYFQNSFQYKKGKGVYGCFIWIFNTVLHNIVHLHTGCLRLNKTMFIKFRTCFLMRVLSDLRHILCP